MPIQVEESEQPTYEEVGGHMQVQQLDQWIEKNGHGLGVIDIFGYFKPNHKCP